MRVTMKAVKRKNIVVTEIKAGERKYGKIKRLKL